MACARHQRPPGQRTDRDREDQGVVESRSAREQCRLVDEVGCVQSRGVRPVAEHEDRCHGGAGIGADGPQRLRLRGSHVRHGHVNIVAANGP